MSTLLGNANTPNVEKCPASPLPRFCGRILTFFWDQNDVDMIVANFPHFLAKNTAIKAGFFSKNLNIENERSVIFSFFSFWEKSDHESTVIFTLEMPLKSPIYHLFSKHQKRYFYPQTPDTSYHTQPNFKKPSKNMAYFFFEITMANRSTY